MGNVLDQFLPIFIKIRYVLQGSKVDLSDGYILDSVLDDLRMVEMIWKFHKIILSTKTFAKTVAKILQNTAKILQNVAKILQNVAKVLQNVAKCCK